MSQQVMSKAQEREISKKTEKINLWVERGFTVEQVMSGAWNKFGLLSEIKGNEVLFYSHILIKEADGGWSLGRQIVVHKITTW